MLNMKILSQFCFDAKIFRKNCSFVSSVHRKPTVGVAFTNYESYIPKNQKEDSYIHYSIGVSAYVVISRHMNTIIWRLLTGKAIILWILLIRVLSLFLNNLYEPKVIIQNLPERVLLLSCILGNYLYSNLKRSFKIYLLINWSLVILKLLFRHLLESKAFSPSKIRYLSVEVAMLPIMVRPNVILKCDFVNIQTFYISLEKRLRLTTIS